LPDASYFDSRGEHQYSLLNVDIADGSYLMAAWLCYIRMSGAFTELQRVAISQKLISMVDSDLACPVDMSRLCPRADSRFLLAHCPPLEESTYCMCLCRAYMYNNKRIDFAHAEPARYVSKFRRTSAIIALTTG
jgi:hypothetical protein